MISSLVAQQKAAEEALIIRQFRNGEKTYADIAAFYDNWALAAGLQEGDPGYDTFMQNKSDFYNEDLVMTENKLWSTFSTTNGSNYTELMAFLNNDAMTSTNEGDKQKFAELKKSATNNYIAYAVDMLKDGKITVEEFNSTLNENLSQAFDPGSQEFKDAQLNGMIVEYNAEISKWDKRQAAGLPNAISGTKEFIRKFQSQLLAAGVDKNSDIFLTTQVDLKTTVAKGAAGAADSSYTRANAAEKKLSKIFVAAAKAAGITIDPITTEDMLKGKTHYGANDFIQNSEVFAALNRMVVSGQVEMPQELIDLGITNLSDFNAEVDSKVSTIATNYAAANSSSPTQAGSVLAITGRALKQSIGTHSGADELKDAALQYSEDLQAASMKNDTPAQMAAVNQWKNYLNGGVSKYGSLPPAASFPGVLGQSYLDGIEASKSALNGGTITQFGIEDRLGVPGLMVLDASGAANNVSFSDYYKSGTIQAMSAEVELLKAGLMVEVVTPGQPNSVVLPSAASAGGKIGNTLTASKNGYLNILTFKDFGDGQMVPVVQSLKNSGQIGIGSATSEGTTAESWGFQYTLNDGVTKLYVKKDNTSYLGWPFDAPQTTGGGNILVPLNTTISKSTPEKGLPQLDFTSLMEGTNYNAFRNNIETAKKALIANPSMLAVLGISPGVAVDPEALFKPAVEKADQLELKDINTQLQTLTRDSLANIPSVQARIESLSSRIGYINEGLGQTMTSKYDLVIKPNIDKFERLPNGTYKISDAAKKAAGTVQVPNYVAGAGPFGVVQIDSYQTQAPVLGADGKPLEDIIYDPRPTSVINAERTRLASQQMAGRNFAAGFGGQSLGLSPLEQLAAGRPAPTAGGITPAKPTTATGITPSVKPAAGITGTVTLGLSNLAQMPAAPVPSVPITVAGKGGGGR
jgi:hypothetical protein